MNHRRITGPAALLATCGFASGCLDTDGSPVGTNDPATDEEAIEYVLAGESADLSEIDVRYFDEDSGADAAPIATERWRRELLRFDRDVRIEIDPDAAPPTASVSVSGHAVGLLHLWAPAPDPESSPVVVRKDFEDSGVRSMLFERVRNRTARHRGWRLAAISGVEISSPGATRRIHSVRIQSGDVDATITDPSALVALEDLIAVPRESEVAVTVDTGDASDSVFLHLRHLRARLELRSNEDGTFTGSFHTAFGDGDRPDDRPGDRARPRHMVIDVLSEGTLYDDEAPYDNAAWGITYLLAGETDLGPRE
jgi:hypothetical protein